MTKRSLTALSLLALVAIAGAPRLAGAEDQPKPGAAPAAAADASKGLEFDFTDMKGVNAISFTADSTLEPITGFGSGVGGKVTMNPADPKSLAGELTLETAKLKVSNDGMTKVMLNADWLDAEKNKEITFKIKKVADSKPGKAANSFDLTVTGDMTLHGVTKEMTVPVSATYLAGRLGDRVRGVNGDLLVLRSNFSVKRGDFGIKPGQGVESVADEIQIRAAIVGACKK